MIKTIHDLLPTTRGNVKELARILNVNRATITKYIDDREGKRHAVVNGVLMVATGSKGRYKR